MEQNDAITFLALVSHVLCYANSAINPLIYNFMSGKFRREFRRSFCCSASPIRENFTTLTHLTTSKTKRPCDLVTFECRTPAHYKSVCSSSLVGNGYRNNCLR
ncbi:orexin receptor type 2-like [Galleria mellonella]|uniref:Orexin receptor type 2-like n=1 Tax=Galleria mellonella TaxID=7137 RepID=A0ABM3N6H3_GALME|nr:orexin receptor type 2-like [Galleria mellonella]